MIITIKDNISSGKISSKVKTLQKSDIFVKDEIGYQAMEPEVFYYFFQIISERYEKSSVINIKGDSYRINERKKRVFTIPVNLRNKSNGEKLHFLSVI